MDPVHEAAPVRFELGFARSARTDAAGLLGERSTLAPQTGQAVLQECELDLRFAFGRAGVLREDVQDHRGPIDRGAPEDLLQVALLGRREIVFEHDGVGVDGQTDLAELLHLARTQERRRIG